MSAATLQRRGLVAALACCALWSAAGGASARPQQAAKVAAPALARQDIDERLRRTDRERIHHGEPLELVGREQGDNDLRSRTPALAHSDRAVASVDTDELYRRRLAMYDDGAVFHEALPALDPAGRPLAAVRTKPRASAPPPAETADEGLSSTAVLAIGATLLGLVWFLWNRRD